MVCRDRQLVSDLAIDLEEGNVRRFIGVMAQLGFVPRAPVAAADLASADHRRDWAADKLRWLEETRQFLDRFLTPERKALMERFRRGEL